jgi:hypothetical protein
MNLKDLLRSCVCSYQELRCFLSLKYFPLYIQAGRKCKVAIIVQFRGLLLCMIVISTDSLYIKKVIHNITFFAAVML